MRRDVWGGIEKRCLRWGSGEAPEVGNEEARRGLRGGAEVIAEAEKGSVC